MAPQARVQLFGAPSVLDSGGSPIPKLGAGKPLALLAYLVVQGETPRDTIVGVLWGDVPEAKARNAFRQALHRLRAALGEDSIPHDPDRLKIADGFDLASDVREFNRALTAGNYDEAVDQYRGEFLSGLDVGESAFEQWAQEKRASFHARFCDALRASLQADIERGASAEALKKADQLAAASPLDPEVAVLHASTLLGAGRRAEARQAIDHFSERYERDFGRTPPAAIREMAVKLRRAPSDPSTAGQSRVRPAAVGREEELSLLLARWRTVQTGEGSLVFLVGDQGMGKTRVIEEFFSRAKDLGSPLLLFGRERALGSDVSFASIAEALRGTLNAAGLAGTSQHLLGEAARLIPQLRDQFSLPELTPISDDAGRLRFFEGVAALIDSVAYEQPVCIAIDDFHNCSPTTAELAYYLTERLRGAPVLFLFAARPTPEFFSLRERFIGGSPRGAVGPKRGGSRETNSGTVIDVGPMNPAEARAFVLSLAEGLLSGEMVAQIIAISEGVPYRLDDTTHRALAGEPLGAAPIRLRDVLWARLRTCTQAEQRLFVAAALLDRPASIRLLAAASHLSESSALDATLSLVALGLLSQRESGLVPSHDLATELALEGPGPAGRALLAGWAGDALLREGSGTDAELAQLFSAAGRREEIFRFSRAAAYSAAMQGAAEEAARYFNVALAAARSENDRREMEKMSAVISVGPRQLSGTVEIPPTATDLATERRGAGGVPRRTPGESEKTASADPPATESARPASRFARGSSPAQVRRLFWMLLAAGIVLLAIVRGVARVQGKVPGTSLADTLFVSEQISAHDSVAAFITGPLGSPVQVAAGSARVGRRESWIDSVKLPWINPRLSPNGEMVALERMNPRGSDIFAISFNRKDTIPIAVGPGDDISAGWSPDGRWLLATHGEAREDGGYDADLFAFSVTERGRRIALDTSKARSVVDASWSPDGTHIAWAARTGDLHQQEVYVSDADGTNILNVSNNPSEDYNLAWAPDGGRIAFTSERSGSAELYSAEIGTGEVRRLTWDAAHVDRAAFSPDGRWMAYESTRGGNASVYVMPSRGGTGRNVAPNQRRVSITEWRGAPISYVRSVSLDAAAVQPVSQSQLVTVHETDQFGRPMRVGAMRLAVLDPSLASIEPLADRGSSPPETAHANVVGLSGGLARIEASAAGWRADTAYVTIGNKPLTLLQDGFERELARNIWKELGLPAPVVQAGGGKNRSSGLVAWSDTEWESGILSSSVFPVRSGLRVEAWVHAPFNTAANGGTSFDIALVAADPEGVPDSVAPQFLRLVAASWIGEAGRMRYGVDREIFTEPATHISPTEWHNIVFEVGPNERVAFFLDGALRWTSTLKVRVSGDNSRAQLWLGSHDAGSSVVFDDVAVKLTPEPAPRR